MSAMLIAAILLLVGISAAEAAPETICSNAAVFLCENWEDRPVGNQGLVGAGSWPALGGKIPRWDLDAANSNTVDSAEPGVAGGVHSLKLSYPACSWVDAQGGNACSAGSMGTDWSAKSDMYFRLYLKWASTWMWSPQHFTKIQALEVANIPTAGVSRREPWMYTDSDNGHMFLEDEAHNNARYDQNQGNDITFALNTWYCVEMHVARNTSNNTGTFEVWVDDVLRLRATGLANFDQNWVDFLLDGFWNTGSTPGSRGATARWLDNIVGSTARINCVGSSPPPAPNPPTNLHFVSLLLGAAFLGALKVWWLRV